MKAVCIGAPSIGAPMESHAIPADDLPHTDYRPAARARSYGELVAGLPPEWEGVMRLEALIAGSHTKLVVLDDDPTGTQTVHGIWVLTDWSTDMLRRELISPEPVVYLSTNSRSYEPRDARNLNAEIGRRLVDAAGTTGCRFQVVSRTDSTLRGHFPDELDGLQAALGEFDGWLVVPYFGEGGRYTVGDVHYVVEGDRAIPVGETEFAKDESFGFAASDLKEWVEEKTRGHVRADEVMSISIEDIRQGGPDRIYEKLKGLRSGSVCVVNAATRRDLETFVVGLLWAEASGRRFVYRCAASLVAVRSGIPPRPSLTPRELAPLLEGRGGLVVVGSQVQLTTRQLEVLMRNAPMINVEVEAGRLADPRHADEEIEKAVTKVEAALKADREVALFTSRVSLHSKPDDVPLRTGQRISKGLGALVASLSVRPRYIITKGGITSSDVATSGLDVRRAYVLGQLLPGVAVWRLGEESRYPRLPYAVFPGNVGGDNSLFDAWAVLDAARKESSSRSE